MSEDSDLERTEAPSQRRLEQAREEGQVLQSRELATFLVVIGAAAGLWMLGPGIGRELVQTMREALAFDGSGGLEDGFMLVQLAKVAGGMLWAVAPLMALLVLAACAAPLLLGGVNFTFQPLAPDLDRLNPVAGLGRMFSVHAIAELIKAVLKAAVVGSVAVYVAWQSAGPTALLPGESTSAALAHAAELVGWGFLLVALALALIAAADVPYQLWSHHRKLRMTREQLRQEAKESDGDPHVKAHIRAQQREMARRRMMSEVPKADVIVTNPTHYAVAMRYRNSGGQAPVVVAKGARLIAGRIRELGLEHGVPLLEAPPLARALYRHVEVGQEIPEALYAATAEVLAYVYQLKRHNEGKAPPPTPPVRLPVPAGLDPEDPRNAPAADKAAAGPAQRGQS